MERPKIEIEKPRKFGLAGVVASHASSFLLGIPVLIALVLVSAKDLGILNLVIPVLTLVAVIYILPLFGNAYVSRVVGGLRPTSSAEQNGFTVQITLCPRIRKGLRALIEDADDVGWLSFGDSDLTFRGDSVQMVIPFQRIKAIHGENVGLRGLYVTAGRVILDISGLDGFEGVEIAERSSRVLPASRRITRELFARIRSRTEGREPL